MTSSLLIAAPLIALGVLWLCDKLIEARKRMKKAEEKAQHWYDCYNDLAAMMHARRVKFFVPYAHTQANPLFTEDGVATWTADAQTLLGPCQGDA